MLNFFKCGKKRKLDVDAAQEETNTIENDGKDSFEEKKLVIHTNNIKKRIVVDTLHIDFDSDNNYCDIFKKLESAYEIQDFYLYLSTKNFPRTIAYLSDCTWLLTSRNQQRKKLFTNYVIIRIIINIGEAENWILFENLWKLVDVINSLSEKTTQFDLHLVPPQLPTTIKDFSDLSVFEVVFQTLCIKNFFSQKFNRVWTFDYQRRQKNDFVIKYAESINVVLNLIPNIRMFLETQLSLPECICDIILCKYLYSNAFSDKGIVDFRNIRGLSSDLDCFYD